MPERIPCQCEHKDHFAPAVDRRHPRTVHEYGAFHHPSEIVRVKTTWGTFTMCKHCAVTCFGDQHTEISPLDYTPNTEAVARALEFASLAVAQWVNENRSTLLYALDHFQAMTGNRDKMNEVAEMKAELVELLGKWSDASNNLARAKDAALRNRG